MNETSRSVGRVSTTTTSPLCRSPLPSPSSMLLLSAKAPLLLLLAASFNAPCRSFALSFFYPCIPLSSMALVRVKRSALLRLLSLCSCGCTSQSAVRAGNDINTGTTRNSAAGVGSRRKTDVLREVETVIVRTLVSRRRSFGRRVTSVLVQNCVSSS